ncbi:MAG TPA: phenylalanine--tRNA ligase subunit beta, partial [Luteimonas sp.]|nr:phenylalanine--tRNA ligase subunit beta [Luteimonas sp.]
AGHRFERGVDPALPRVAIELATRLLVEQAGGRPGPTVVTDIGTGVPAPRTIALRRARLARLLGVSIADADVQRILAALDLAPETTAAGWTVTVPTRRFDLAIEEDLVEEVARIHGYDAIATALPGGTTRMSAPAETEIADPDLRRHLASRDYMEALNYAFVDAGVLAQWHAEEGAVALANPLSAELGVMRTELMPGLVAALGRNLARQQPRVRLFETGNVFALRGGELLETPRVAAVACGDVAAKPWDGAARRVDFHDIKGDLQSLAALSGAALVFDAGGVRNGHPGRSARILQAGRVVGWIAELHPRLLAGLGIECGVVAFELDVDALRRRALPRAAAVSRFPAVRRDLAFIVAEGVPWAAVEGTVRGAGGASLKEVQLFDRYLGGGVETGFKSLAMGLILQDDSRTLTDRDADAVVADVVDALGSAHAARIRG